MYPLWHLVISSSSNWKRYRQRGGTQRRGKPRRGRRHVCHLEKYRQRCLQYFLHKLSWDSLPWMILFKLFLCFISFCSHLEQCFLVKFRVSERNMCSVRSRRRSIWWWGRWGWRTAVGFWAQRHFRRKECERGSTPPTAPLKCYLLVSVWHLSCSLWEFQKLFNFGVKDDTDRKYLFHDPRNCEHVTQKIDGYSVSKPPLCAPST